ncbi:MAG: DUF3524 domain-containing protein [Spirochaetaceae bacterium]|jgi:glycosyltransferase involved in cell wall biosynthesis|nr:DUF3524 domain-containing protein [Spirochaetaceae bacterium]
MGNFLFLEPFYGGSHKYFADGLKKYSNHNITLETLPDRFWKWRMRGASLYFAERITNPSSFDGIIVSNMLSLSDLKAVWHDISIPFILYFHENQILYPLSKGEKEDLHYGITDLTSSLAADFIFFNSHYHKNAFLKALRPFIKRLPDFNPYWIIDKISEKSDVLYPGCSIPEHINQKNKPQNPPLILWNHRWEHDKNPDDFFSVFIELDKININFQLAILGEQYKTSPPIFNEIKRILKDKIVQFGYLENYDDYVEWLKKSDIVISTSHQENFGISIVDAIGYGSFPLLPDRLSYRELISEEFHNLCIYKNLNDLKKKLIKLIQFYDTDILKNIIKQNYRFSWKNQIIEFDNKLNYIIKKSRP